MRNRILPVTLRQGVRASVRPDEAQRKVKEWQDNFKAYQTALQRLSAAPPAPAPAPTPAHSDTPAPPAPPANSVSGAGEVTAEARSASAPETLRSAADAPDSA